MTTLLSRTYLTNGISGALKELLPKQDTNIVIGEDGDRILVFAPGGPYFAVTVEELKLTPTRTARKVKP